MAPLKALKASPGSSARWVGEAQAAIQRGAASARVDPKEPAAQGGAAEVAPTQTREGVPPPREGEAHESDGAGVPLVAEAPGVSGAEATEARASKTDETVVAAVGVSASSEAVVMAARPSVHEAGMQATEASVVPLVQGPPLVYPVPSDDTSRAREVVDAEETNAVEQPAPLLDEGGSALVRVRPEPRGWDHPRVLWQSRDDPEGEPLLALEDAAEGGRWNTFEQYR